MSWYQKVNHYPNHVENQVTSSEDITLQKLDHPHNEEPSKFTVLSEYVLSAIVIEDEGTHIFLKVKSMDIAEVVLEEIRPHFKFARGTYQKGELVQAHFWGINEQSRETYERINQAGKIDPFVLDLRGNQAASVESRYDVPKQLEYYKIISASLEKVNSVDFERLWWFLNETADAGGGKIILMPTNWTFGEHLQQSYVLRSLGGVCDEIYVAVERNTNLVHYITCFVH